MRFSFGTPSQRLESQRTPSPSSSSDPVSEPSSPKGILKKVQTEKINLGPGGIGAKSVKKEGTDKPEDSIQLTQEWLSKKMEIDQRKDTLLNINLSQLIAEYNNVN